MTRNYFRSYTPPEGIIDTRLFPLVASSATSIPFRTHVSLRGRPSPLLPLARKVRASGRRKKKTKGGRGEDGGRACRRKRGREAKTAKRKRSTRRVGSTAARGTRREVLLSGPLSSLSRWWQVSVAALAAVDGHHLVEFLFLSSPAGAAYTSRALHESPVREERARRRAPRGGGGGGRRPGRCLT